MEVEGTSPNQGETLSSADGLEMGTGFVVWLCSSSVDHRRDTQLRVISTWSRGGTTSRNCMNANSSAVEAEKAEEEDGTVKRTRAMSLETHTMGLDEEEEFVPATRIWENFGDFEGPKD